MSLATLSRVVAGFGLGVVGRHLARRARRLFDLGAPADRSEPAGPARGAVDRLDSIVHSVARNLRDVQGRADRRRRVLPGLSRRHGRGDVGRPQDRRGRPHLPSVRLADGAAYSFAGGAAGLRDRAALGAWARLDVRRRRRVHGRLRRSRLSADRRPATRQAGRRSSPPSSPSPCSARQPTGSSLWSPRRSCAGKTTSRAARRI